MIRAFIIPSRIMPTSAQPQTTKPAPRGVVEPDGVNVNGIVLFLIILAITVAIVHLVVSATFLKLKRSAAMEDQQTAEHGVTASVAATRTHFPAPHEQISPQLDLQALRAQQESELNSYGWVDAKAGVVRMPIERAMVLIVERGLPTRSGNGAAATGPSSLQLQQLRPAQSTPPQKEEGR